MSTSVIIAAAYLILTFQGTGLSNNTVKIIAYTSMKQCEVALAYEHRQPDRAVASECLPGSTDWHEPDANKP